MGNKTNPVNFIPQSATRSHDPVPLLTCIFLFITDGEGRGGADSRKSDGGHAWYWTQHRGIPLKLLRDAPIVPVLRTCCTQYRTQHLGIPLKLLRQAPVVYVLRTQYSVPEYELCIGNISCSWDPSFIYLQYWFFFRHFLLSNFLYELSVSLSVYYPSVQHTLRNKTVKCEHCYFNIISIMLLGSAYL